MVYEYGTPDESFEWTQIRGATGGEVQVLDDTIDLMQVLPGCCRRAAWAELAHDNTVHESARLQARP